MPFSQDTLMCTNAGIFSPLDILFMSSKQSILKDSYFKFFNTAYDSFSKSTLQCFKPTYYSYLEEYFPERLGYFNTLLDVDYLGITNLCVVNINDIQDLKLGNKQFFLMQVNDFVIYEKLLLFFKMVGLSAKAIKVRKNSGNTLWFTLEELFLLRVTAFEVVAKDVSFYRDNYFVDKYFDKVKSFIIREFPESFLKEDSVLFKKKDFYKVNALLEDKNISYFQKELSKQHDYKFILRFLGVYLSSGYRKHSLIRLRFSKLVCVKYKDTLDYFISYLESRSIYYKIVYRSSFLYIELEEALLDFLDFLFPFTKVGVEKEVDLRSYISYSFINYLSREELTYLLEGVLLSNFCRFGYYSEVNPVFVITFRKFFYNSVHTILYYLFKYLGLNVSLQEDGKFYYLFIKDFDRLKEVLGFNLFSFLKDFDSDKDYPLYLLTKLGKYTKRYHRALFGMESCVFVKSFNKVNFKDTFSLNDLNLKSCIEVPSFRVSLAEDNELSVDFLVMKEPDLK